MSVIEKALGDDYSSTSVEDQAKQIQAAYKQAYPDALATESQGARDLADTRLGIAQKVTPGYNDLALNEFDRNQAKASAIQGRYDSAQAANDVANLQSHGVQAGQALLAADNAANPEAAAIRAGAGAKYGQLLDNLDPNLSAGTRAEIERGTARLSPSGTQNSAVSTAEKAMQFGSAHEQHLNNFANVLNGVSAALPQLKTGLNPAALALGRDSRTSPVAGGLTGATAADNTAFSRGSQIYQGLNQASMNKVNVDAGKFKSFGDALNQDADSFNKVASGAGALGA
jgi:hypothetical protein